MTESPIESEIIRLAEKVAEAQDDDIPGLLIALKDLLEKYPDKTQESTILKKSIWKYDLLSWCAIALRYDYMKIYGGFEVAVTIGQILCDCCCSLNVNDSQEFSQSTLPDAICSCLRLLRQLQQKISDNIKKPRSQRVENSVLAEQLLTTLTTLITAYPHLSVALFNSSDLLRLVMDGDKLSSRSIQVMLRAIFVNKFCLARVTQHNLLCLLDELVYKLTASEDEAMAALSTRLILAMSDSYNPLVNIIVSRFKGLKAILTRWKDRDFDRDLNRLINLLDAGTAQKALLARQMNAASTIWAFYKGWKTRQQMKKLKSALPKLQRSFRQKQAEKREDEEDLKSARMQKLEADLQKKRSFRKTREKQLHSLEILPAGKVTNFIQDEENNAAVRIQAHWRAHAQRKEFRLKREAKKKDEAAVVIQRGVRRMLKKKSRQSSIVHGRDELDDESRDRHMKTIDRWQAVNKRMGVPHEEAESIHVTAQQKLLSYHRRKIVTMKENQKTAALLARIHTEEATLNHLPSLADSDDASIDQLFCNSIVIQRAATIEHNNEMKKLTQPWWKLLNQNNNELELDGW